MSLLQRGARAFRTLGTGLMLQALLSGANFVVGLFLIRRTSELQYSYYILATNTLLLLTALQTAFIQPYIVKNLTTLPLDARRNVIGALIRDNRRWLPLACAGALILVAILRLVHLLNSDLTLFVAVGLIAGALALSREFFRVTLFAYRRPTDVLRGDAAYVSILLLATFLATLLPDAALFAVAGVAAAHLCGYLILKKELWRHEPWNPDTKEQVLARIAAAGSWAIFGSAIHWLLIQGYSFLVAGVLDVKDIAAIAATRLTLMPVFVLSGGVSMLLFPHTSRWLHELGTKAAARRLTMLVGGLAILALTYMGTMWLLRDWIFAVILKKSFPQRDPLILLWSAVFLVTLCRDQLATLSAAHGRFREMTLMTAFSAAIWLLCSYTAMMQWGSAGAVFGILVGETVNIAGILLIISRESRQPVPAPAHSA